MQPDGTVSRQRIKELHVFEGMGRKRVESVDSGDICALVGIEGFEIGDTVSTVENPEPLPRIAIDEPTMSMTFAINDSPFFGRDGKYVTSRHIWERLQKELDRNLALRVAKTDREDQWIVYGRGVLHLSVLIETMRREGFELQVGQPQVIIREIDGVKCEPVELLSVNLPKNIEQDNRHGDTPSREISFLHDNSGRPRPSRIPYSSRGIIGLATMF